MPCNCSQPQRSWLSIVMGRVVAGVAIGVILMIIANCFGD